MFYKVKIPKIVKLLAPSLIYNIDSMEKIVYLTFDDGPIPETTPEILDILDMFQAKATFFCLGKNVKTNPDLFALIKSKGHAVGNHSYNHLNGWKTKKKQYFEDIEKANELINSSMFRPPYGKITPGQIKSLRKKYKIVMWDVLSGDFDPSISTGACVKNVLKNTNYGSIIVFHDSIKAKKTVLKALPLVLENLAGQGYEFKSL